MSGDFEGDLIRPLGLVTLYFGYAEAQVNLLLGMLKDCGLRIAVSPIAPFGQRLADIKEEVKQLTCAGAAEVLGLLEEARELLEQRNSLVHGCVLAKGRVIPNDSGKSEFYVTPEALKNLADRVFNWKERLNDAVQRRLVPALRERGTNGT